jgi:hypothetical protein
VQLQFNVLYKTVTNTKPYIFEEIHIIFRSGVLLKKYFFFYFLVGHHVVKEIHKYRKHLSFKTLF